MKKLFTNDTFFAIVTWFAAICTIPFAIDIFLYYPNQLLYLANLSRLLIMFCLIVVYISYRRHSKNVMKGMMGAILAFIVVITSVPVFVYDDYKIFSYICLVSAFVLFINHFIINSDHHSKPGSILLNQILVALFAVFSLIEGITLFSECVNTYDSIVTILNCIAQPCCMLSIVCIESRLDAYRKDREAAGWTEEKGYPKGYVHEYEKK